VKVGDRVKGGASVLAFLEPPKVLAMEEERNALATVRAE